MAGSVELRGREGYSKPRGRAILHGHGAPSAWVAVQYSTMSSLHPDQERAMTKPMTKAVTQEESREPVKKTPADHLSDTLAQLKEMRHYSKTNVEHMTAIWMLFDGELSKLKRTDKIEDLMNRQGQLHDALESVIADLEDALQKLQPPTE
jgi:hypothetical protein